MSLKLKFRREDGLCVWCKEKVHNLKDQLSIKEYNISGLCQKCQDKVFDVL